MNETLSNQPRIPRERAIALLRQRFDDPSKVFGRECVAALFREIERLQKRDEMARGYIEDLHENGIRELTAEPPVATHCCGCSLGLDLNRSGSHHVSWSGEECSPCDRAANETSPPLCDCPTTECLMQKGRRCKDNL